MRSEGKKIKYNVLTISSDLTINQFTHRIINPTASCKITFDLTDSNKSTFAQFTIYASESIVVQIEVVDGSGSSIIATAKGYTVINTIADGTPIVGVTGTGNGSGGGFISEVEYPSNNANLTENGKLLIVSDAGSALTVDSSLEVEGSFFYVVNVSGSTITFEGDTIPNTNKIGYVYNPAGSDWVRFMEDKGATSGFINEIIYTSSNYTVGTSALQLVVDTAGVIITPDSALNAEPNFFYISNTSDGYVTFEGNSIGPANKIGFVYSDTNNAWEIFMKYSGTVLASTSHLVGFGSKVNDDDPAQTDFFMDVHVLVPDVVIDISKYNLFFNDGTPSWKILASGVEVHSVSAKDVIITTP